MEKGFQAQGKKMLSGANPIKDPLSDLDSAVHTLASFLGGTVSFARDCPRNLDGQL